VAEIARHAKPACHLEPHDRHDRIAREVRR
jgi:hypothetical protein